jgi:hypothetical protein
MGIRTDLEKQTQERVEAEAAANEEAAFGEFFMQHPELDLQANRQILKDYCAGYPIDLDSLDYALANIGGRLARKDSDQVAREEKRERDALIAELFEGLHLPHSTRVNRQRAYELMDIPSLRAAAEQRRSEKALLKMNNDELKATIRGSRPVVTPPPVIVPFTKQQINAMSAKEFRKLLYFSDGQSRPGVQEEVTRILAGKN